MRRRFKIAFVILLVATLVWAVALYLHVHAWLEATRKGIDALLYVGPFSISAIVIVASWITSVWKQFRHAKEGLRMRRKSKIAFVILLVATIVWTLAWHQHMTAYNQMRKEEQEWLEKWLEEHGIVDMLGLEKPFRWLFYGYGEFLTISGLVIFVTWEFLLERAFDEWKKYKTLKNEKVGFVAESLKTLVAVVILLFFFIIIIYAPLIFRV